MKSFAAITAGAVAALIVYLLAGPSLQMAGDCLLDLVNCLSK